MINKENQTVEAVAISPDEALMVRESCLSAAIRRADRALSHIYDEALRPAGLRATQFNLLVAVQDMAPVTQKALAANLVMEKTTLTRNLQPLERDGLVAVAQGAEDRRSHEIVLTAKGRALLHEAFPLWRRAQKQAERVLGANRVSELVAELRATVFSLR